MRLFDDSKLLQSMMDGGVHQALIRNWLRTNGLHVLSESAIMEGEKGAFTLEMAPSIRFQLKRATIKDPHPEIISVSVHDRTWTIQEENSIQQAIFQHWNAISHPN